MTSRALVLLVLGGLLPLAGCGAPDISGEVSDYAAAVDGSRTRLCDCPQLQGYAMIGECKDALGDVSEDEEACIAGALEGDEERGAEYLTCATSATMAYSDCLASNESCEDSTLMVCMSSFEGDLAACSASDVRGSVDSCLP